MAVSHVEIAGAMRLLDNVGRQGPFVVASALTALAKDAQAAIETAMPEIFDRPVPFTQRAVAILPATKAGLVAQVFVKDAQARYLGIQETGGTRKARSGMPVIVPVRIGVNASGNVPKGAIRREKAKPDTFVSMQDDPRTRHLPPGVYRRGGTGRRRHGGRGPKGALRIGAAGKKAGVAAFAGRLTSLKLLVAFEKAADYVRRFGFTDRAVAIIRRKTPERLREAVAKALATARR